MIYEYDFFDRNQLRQITSLFDAGKFVDGARTGPKSKLVKDNTQQSDIDLNKMANTAITKILKESDIYHLHPLNKCSPCYMLKYELGQHYADHVDYWDMWGSRTDYTAVITLNDDYDGGEHFIQIGTETIERRLEPGKILIYQSDFIHGVRPVTNGVRKCVTFWMESAIPDPTMRYYITEMNKLYFKLHEVSEGEGEIDRETLVLLDHVRCGIVKRQLQMRN
jgi:predicted 2-oxoglutarate/Fe(II)-dependent dioxygenase YbiX